MLFFYLDLNYLAAGPISVLILTILSKQIWLNVDTFYYGKYKEKQILPIDYIVGFSLNARIKFLSLSF